MCFEPMHRGLEILAGALLMETRVALRENAIALPQRSRSLPTAGIDIQVAKVQRAW